MQTQIDSSQQLLPPSMFDQRLKGEIALFQRTSQPLSCLAVLIRREDGSEPASWWANEVASHVAATCRPSDSVCHVEDGVLIILAPATRLAKAVKMGDRISNVLQDTLASQPVCWSIAVCRPISIGDTNPVPRAIAAAEKALASGNGSVVAVR